MTKDLTTLLDRLKAADPDTWQECNLAYNALCVQWAEGAIQAIIQAACKKRHYDVIQWVVHFNDEVGYIYQSRIIAWYKNGNYRNKYEQFFAEGSSSASALLSAYLAAISKANAIKEKT